MAGRGRTARLVVNGCHHPQNPMARLGMVNPAARGDGEADNGLTGGVAGVARLGPLIDKSADLPAVGGEGDLALLVEDSDLFDSLLPSDGLHDLVGVVSTVF